MRIEDKPRKMKDTDDAEHAIESSALELQRINDLLESEVAARKCAEDALDQSQRSLADLLENATDLIQSVDKHGRFIYVNRAWRQTLGYEPEEIEGLSLLDIIHPESREHCIETFKRVLSGEVVSGIETTFITKNGDRVLVEGNTSCRFENGEPVATRGIFRNITEHRRIEAKFADLSQSEEMERLELQKETGARSQFINVLAHELRTPLTPLIASAGLLEETFRHKPKSTEYRLANVLLTGAYGLSKRLSDLLDLARLMSGNITPHMEIFDIKPIMLKIYSEFVVKAAERDQSLEIDTPDGLPDLEADKYRLEQMLSNLISNAINFNSVGKPVVLRVRSKANRLIIEVQDHGEGISQKEQQMIFQPYHHVEQDRQRFAGLGLGLAISKHIAEAHCGTITLNSQEGKGNTFTVSLPLDQGKTTKR